MSIDPTIMEYATLAKTILTGGAKLWKEYRARAFTEYERALLVAAADSGDFYLLTAQQLPAPIVRAGAATFSDNNDPAVAAHFRDAFKSLIRRGYIEHDAGQHFTLTGEGFDKARSLKA